MAFATSRDRWITVSAGASAARRSGVHGPSSARRKKPTVAVDEVLVTVTVVFRSAPAGPAWLTVVALAPTVAIVNNIEADHLDIYADLADIKSAFARFVRGARSIVLCADDGGANSLPTPSSTEGIRFGIQSPDARVVARDLMLSPNGATYRLVYDDEDLSPIELRVPGRHNVLNSLAALSAGLAIGRYGEAEEFAAMACFLCSDHAGFTTGTAINMDGGATPVV